MYQILYQAAQDYKSRGQIYAALSHFQQALNWAETQGQIQIQALMFLEMGKLMAEAHLPEEARQCFSQSSLLGAQMGQSELIRVNQELMAAL